VSLAGNNRRFERQGLQWGTQIAHALEDPSLAGLAAFATARRRTVAQLFSTTVEPTIWFCRIARTRAQHVYFRRPDMTLACTKRSWARRSALQ